MVTDEAANARESATDLLGTTAVTRARMSAFGGPRSSPLRAPGATWVLALVAVLSVVGLVTIGPLVIGPVALVVAAVVFGASRPRLRAVLLVLALVMTIVLGFAAATNGTSELERHDETRGTVVR